MTQQESASGRDASVTVRIDLLKVEIRIEPRVNAEDNSTMTFTDNKKNTLKSIENLAAASSQASGGSNLGSSNLSGSISGNLSAVGVTNWDKLPSFNSKHSQKGHSLQERIFDRVAECTVCGGLIWGLAPQGLTCQACDVSIHHRCKSGLKEACTKESKSSNLNRGSVSNVSMSASAGTPPNITSFSVPRSSCSMNSPASVSQYPYLPEPTNSSDVNMNMCKVYDHGFDIHRRMSSKRYARTYLVNWC
ncbi:hypothetical protein ACTXT7_014655 [Hymenolepis weldensis]